MGKWGKKEKKKKRDRNWEGGNFKQVKKKKIVAEKNEKKSSD